MTEPRKIGPFILGEKLGEGGMGIVYKATYTKNNQVVALKVLPPELCKDEKLVARFERELAIVRKLKHPHIVNCFGGGRQGSQWFFAMEFIDGGSLSGLLKQRGPMPWQEVINYGIQICEALDYAHERGIIHRDLKPANLMLTREGQLKLADFGIARDTAATGLTATGRTVGTFAYMAPEQVTGTPPASHKTDLYALGCLLFELLTGRTPFVAENPAELFFAHLEKKPPRVTSLAFECPIWLDALINQLLQKDPNDRPYDAATVAEALREVEKKEAERQALSTHLTSGQPSTLNTAGDADVVRDLLKDKPRKKKKKQLPIWEQTWFLVSCLALIGLFVTWALWPLSEEQMFTRAEKLMASSEVTDWVLARDQYLVPLQTKFPEGKYASQVQDFQDKIDMHFAEENLIRSAKWGKDPTSEAERLYAEARKFEQFGDRLTAYEKYRHLANLLQDNKESRPFVNLARRQIATIEASGTDKLNRLQIVDEALTKADLLYSEGKTVEAHKMWNSIVNLYEGNRELAPHVKRARARLKGKDDDLGADPTPAPNAPPTQIPPTQVPPAQVPPGTLPTGAATTVPTAAPQTAARQMAPEPSAIERQVGHVAVRFAHNSPTRQRG